jgi:hypothetical protein
MQNNWFTKVLKIFSTVAQESCSRCMICATNNVGKGQAMKPVGHPSPEKPFSHVMIDYIELALIREKCVNVYECECMK